MSCAIVLFLLPRDAAKSAAAAASDPRKQGASPSRRGPTDSAEAAALERRIKALVSSEKYTEALPLERQLLAMRMRDLGGDHWQTVLTRYQLAGMEQVAGLRADVQIELTKLTREVNSLPPVSRDAACQPLLKRILELRQQHLRQDEIGIARIYFYLGHSFFATADVEDAEKAYSKAIEVYERLLGVQNPRTAEAYLGRGKVLLEQGRLLEGEALARRSLEIRRHLLGEGHAETAESSSMLAGALTMQGRHAEAEPLYRQALRIQRELLGEQNAATAGTYHNLAVCVHSRGLSGDAVPLMRKALDSVRRLRGENDPLTASCAADMAIILMSQGDFDAARPLLEQASTILRRHQNLLAFRPEALTGLAWSYSQRGRYKEAEKLYRELLDLLRKRLGDDHPRLIAYGMYLGMNLLAQGRYAEAELVVRDTLSAAGRSLGDAHPDKIGCQQALAFVLHAQCKYDAARETAIMAARGYELARLQNSRKGLERGAFSHDPPLLFLATSWARASEPTKAWENLEAQLCRGLLEEAVMQERRPTTLAESEREAELVTALIALDREMSARFNTKSDKETRDAAIRDVVRRRQDVETELGRIETERSRREVYILPRIQAKLPPDTAMVAWVEARQMEARGERWACIIRQTGTPIWVNLPGSGANKEWTRSDVELHERVAKALARRPQGNAQELVALLRQLREQRVAPMEKHLTGEPGGPIRRLIVLSASRAADIPLEALTDRYTISYAPSGTFFARLVEHRQKGGAATEPTLFALADPAFGTPQFVTQTAGPEPEQYTLTRGVTTRVFSPLPGTRREVNAIARLFPNAKLLLGPEATREQMQRLASSGDLKPYRYLHFATHAVSDPARQLKSALICAEPANQAIGEHDTDSEPGAATRITAEQILQSWKLNADLVTLSACETGLGKYTAAEGHVGFAQALLLAGARSLLLSLWKVDDTATALLMIRFYENVLGKRPGQSRPLPKAEALREAKEWLRNLTAE
ncbi:MAG TPA: CHAT domain-containing tetratricopeptide repeat protein, partial [Gemmataceae bacterium]|nr:CHAT domain-containing tetratricopeptide repeat protein [Gemmataceae bacterium]